ncbi:hypothetical protein [Flaviramulus basaltis]|nr:hypothetical protein [Flaviramulus basaltis]
MITVYFFGVFYQKELLLQFTIPLLIPAFLIIFLLKNKSLSIPFISFLFFSFLGDISSVFIKGDMFFYVSNTFYFLSFIYLFLIALPKFKLFEVDKLIGIYLVTVFLINTYLLYALYGFLKSVIADGLEVNLFAVKSFMLIILTFLSFGIYLNTQTKRSILFLASCVCFGFSTILDYINVYYLYEWNFIMLHKILYVVGLYFLFSYALIENHVKKHKTSEIKESYSSENILA